MLLCDAQTSGGLLICIKPDNAENMVSKLRDSGYPSCMVIGEVVDKTDKDLGRSFVRNGHDRFLLPFFQALRQKRRQVFLQDLLLGNSIIIGNADKRHFLRTGVIDRITGTGVKITRLSHAAHIDQIISFADLI